MDDQKKELMKKQLQSIIEAITFEITGKPSATTKAPLGYFHTLEEDGKYPKDSLHIFVESGHHHTLYSDKTLNENPRLALRIDEKLQNLRLQPVVVENSEYWYHSPGLIHICFEPTEELAEKIGAAFEQVKPAL